MKVLISIFFIFLCVPVIGQTGTYRLVTATGASSTMVIRSMQSTVVADVFAWWNIPSGTHGTFSGKGTRFGNSSIIKEKDDPSCTLKLTFVEKQLKVQFSGCNRQNLTDDFSGNYNQLTLRTHGTYRTRPAKTYFHKYPRLTKTRKNYLRKGTQVQVDIENIVDDRWVYVNYRDNMGKVSSGYILWSDLGQ
ncbi:hypothetical protein [Sphingobacterium sp. HMA12]|uniref:hypothetical protein n=1 Tax=Sphingobacterium sp. HMA12 TaxID=2050894 RepID=UPI000CEA6196|nr:hypothetical protein [Sphingobacterium sp. HMA12]